jgi:hypothetical protein
MLIKSHGREEAAGIFGTALVVEYYLGNEGMQKG